MGSILSQLEYTFKFYFEQVHIDKYEKFKPSFMNGFQLIPTKYSSKEELGDIHDMTEDDIFYELEFGSF